MSGRESVCVKRRRAMVHITEGGRACIEGEAEKSVEERKGGE